MKYRAVLERTSVASAVRTPTAVGYAEPPMLHRIFYLLGRGLTPGLPYREIWTSRVVALEETVVGDERHYELHTETGSLYRVILQGPPVTQEEVDAYILGQ